MGVWEIALIALVILLVAGPKRLPEIMRTLGSWAGQARNLARGMQSELEREGHHITNGPPQSSKDSAQSQTPRQDQEESGGSPDDSGGGPR